MTVCDQAAGESCPVWPGQPVQAHWSIDDRAAAEGAPDARRLAFERAYRELEHRIQAFTRLPIESLERDALLSRLERLTPDEPQTEER